MQYVGASSTKAFAAARSSDIPATMTLHGKTYEYQRSGRNGKLEVRCDGAEWVTVPDGTRLFVTAAGAMFFDPADVVDTMVVTNGTLCKYQGGCTSKTCTASHPFPCRFGLRCRDQATCKFVHPTPESRVALGAEYPLNQACKHGPSCTNKTCHFAHPDGQVTIGRIPRKLAITHSPELNVLESPAWLELNAPIGATKMLFQGEFVFYFTPYPSTHAKSHFRICTVFRADPERDETHRLLAEYALERHYCNAAVGAGRYFVLSWWPFEDEAMLTIWEGLRRERKREKGFASEMRAKDAYIAKLEAREEKATKIIRNQKYVVRAKNAEIARRDVAAEQAAAASKEREQAARVEERQIAQRQRQLAEQAFWKQQRERDAARDASRQAERLRMRDPIHIYALDGGRDGGKAADWVLLIDYHKGAHELDLVTTYGGAPRMLVTEHDTVYEFDLVAPSSLESLGELPLAPAQLCDGF